MGVDDPKHPEETGATKWVAIARVLQLAGKLKRLRRKGWVDRGVPEPESVADHSYRLALATLLLAARNPELDVERAVTLALVHDLPETIAGDATPFDEILSRQEADRAEVFRRSPEWDPEARTAKITAERSAIDEMVRDLPRGTSELISEAWEEYTAGETPEARLVRQVDKLETWLQALEYRSRDPELVVESFRIGVWRDVVDADLRELLEALEALMNRSQ